MTNRAVSQECQLVEQRLSAMLARVERREHHTPAAPEDGDINHQMFEGLRTAHKLTQSFMTATQAGYSLTYRHERLKEVARSMHSVLAVISAMEGQHQFSPLFDRLMDREYKECEQLIYQMRDAVFADKALMDEEARQPVTASEPPAPLVWACTLLFIPAVLTMAVVSGFAQGLKGTETKTPPAQRERHLKLAYSRD